MYNFCIQFRISFMVFIFWATSSFNDLYDCQADSHRFLFKLVFYHYILLLSRCSWSAAQRPTKDQSANKSGNRPAALCVCAIAGLAASAGQLGKEEDAHPSHERQHEFGGERQRDNREDGLQWPEDDHVHQWEHHLRRSLQWDTRHVPFLAGSSA